MFRVFLQFQAQHNVYPQYVVMVMLVNDMLCNVVLVEARVVEAADLQLVSLEIGNDWRFLGRQLGCSDADLDAVNHDFYVNGQREIAYQMLRGWLEQQGSDAKLAVLARALIGVKRPDVAMKLQLPRN